MADATVTMRLELIAAKAKQLAEDHKANRMWPGDLAAGLREISKQLSEVERSRDALDR